MNTEGMNINFDENKFEREIFKKMNQYEGYMYINYDQNNKGDIRKYISFLYNDTISKEILEELIKDGDKINLLMNDPISVFDYYFEKIFIDFNNNENNNTDIKKKFLHFVYKKYYEIKKNIKECDDDIKLLKDLYIQYNIKKKIPISPKNLKLFNIYDKNVLYYKEKYRIGEIFARYVFNSVFKDNYTEYMNDDRLLPINFYDLKFYNTIFVNNKCDNDCYNSEMKDFDKWYPLLQFWIIYIKIIDILFDKNSNYEEFLNFDKLSKEIKYLRIFKNLYTKSKSSRRKYPRFFGGQFDTQSTQSINFMTPFSMNRKKNNKIFKSKKETIILQKNFRELLRKINISIKNEKKEGNTNIVDIDYFFNGQSTLWPLIDNYYKLPSNSSRFCDDEELNLVFSKSNNENNFKISNLTTPSILRRITAKKNFEKNKDCMNIIKKNIKIFQVLYNYNSKNKYHIIKYLDKIEEELLFINLFVYYKKKIIYTKFIQSFINYLKSKDLPIPTNNNTSNKNNIKTNKINKTNNTNNTNNKLNQLNINDQSKYKSIMKKIKFLQKKRNSLIENKNNVNYDKKIITIDKLIHDLYIQKSLLFK